LATTDLGIWGSNKNFWGAEEMYPGASTIPLSELKNICKLFNLPFSKFPPLANKIQ